MKYSKVLDLRQVAQISGSIESEIGMNTGENEIPLRKRKTENQDKNTNVGKFNSSSFYKTLSTSELWFVTYSESEGQCNKDIFV